MKKTTLLTASLISGAVSLAIFGTQEVQAGHHMEKSGHDHASAMGTDGKTEKCYGVAKAGKNDCADANGKHACGGYSKTDGDPNEWVKVPSGLCEKLVGGSLEPKG